MSCCAPGARNGAGHLGGANMPVPSEPGDQAGEPRAWRWPAPDRSLGAIAFIARACIQAIETALCKASSVSKALASTCRQNVSRSSWRGDEVPPFVADARAAGLSSAPCTIPRLTSKDKTLSELIRAVAVAGFAAGNIMLLSVSVWSGAEGATRDLFHWVSALIAASRRSPLPAASISARLGMLCGTAV